MAQWQLQEAKNRLSALVDAAISGEPQQVTRRGRPAVVVIAAEDYERLCRLEKVSSPTFNDLLLEMPQDDGEFERLPMPARQFES